MKIADNSPYLLLNRTILSLDELQAHTARTIGHLASGQRIDRAADDASGLGAAEDLSSEVRVLAQGLRNIQLAQKIVDTADSALATQTEMVKRLKELATQAASESLAADERALVDSEMDTVVAEISRCRQQHEL